VPVGLAAPDAFYPWTHEKPQGRLCKSKKMAVKHSVYKLARVARTIIGKHLYDAQTILGNID